jgi:chromosome segregation ATPase
MLHEDSEAAAFVSSSQSFDPLSVIARARQQERAALDQKINAAKTELMWAKLRRDHTISQIDGLRDALSDIESKRQALHATTSKPADTLNRAAEQAQSTDAGHNQAVDVVDVSQGPRESVYLTQLGEQHQDIPLAESTEYRETAQE